MCVIGYFATGMKLDKNELENCFTVNPDGAGIMYYDERKQLIKIEKGYMNWAEFWAVAETLPIDTDRVFHFRIATSGAVSKECCHPFPVCDDLDRMRITSQYTKVGMVHNGIIHWCTPAAGLKSPYSDSMYFAQILYELDKGNGAFNQGAKKLINQAASSSKFVIMRDEETMLIGDFQQGDSGAMYSNDSWKGYRTYGRSYSGLSAYSNNWYTGYGEGYYYGTKEEEYAYESNCYKLFFALDNPTEEDAEVLSIAMEDEGLDIFEYNVLLTGIEVLTTGVPVRETVEDIPYEITAHPTVKEEKKTPKKKTKSSLKKTSPKPQGSLKVLNQGRQ